MCFVSFCLSILGLRASGDTRGSSCAALWYFSMSIPGLRGHWVSSCAALNVLFVFQFRASEDTRAPAVGYCLFCLCVNFGSQGTLGVPAVGYCMFCLCVNFGLRGHWGSSCLVLSGLFCVSMPSLEGFLGSSCRVMSGLYVCQFQYASRDTGAQGPQGTLGLWLAGVVCSLCLSISGLRGHRGSSCQVLGVSSVC